jgi:transcriptional antiterminator NusG
MNYWYVLRVALGRERTIEQRLNTKIVEGQWPVLVRFLCPVEKEYYTVNGKKHLRDRVIYGGYLYVESTEPLLKEMVEAIEADPDIKGFLGERGRPQRLSAMDVARIIKDEVLEQRISEKHLLIAVGTKVKVNEGPFIDFVGVVTDINQEKQKVKVVVKIFERENEIDLSLHQIEKQL